MPVYLHCVLGRGMCDIRVLHAGHFQSEMRRGAQPGQGVRAWGRVSVPGQGVQPGAGCPARAGARAPHIPGSRGQGSVCVGVRSVPLPVPARSRPSVTLCRGTKQHACVALRFFTRQLFHFIQHLSNNFTAITSPQ